MDDILKSVINQDPIGFRDEIHSELALKINDALEMKKIQHAQNFVNFQEMPVDSEDQPETDSSAPLEWGTDASVNAYKEMTPGETPTED